MHNKTKKLTTAQWRVLGEVAQEGGINYSIKVQYCSKIKCFQGLYRAGYIRSEVDLDERRITFSLTEEGEAALCQGNS